VHLVGERKGAVLDRVNGGTPLQVGRSERLADIFDFTC
jgi:hypothetical protein